MSINFPVSIGDDLYCGMLKRCKVTWHQFGNCDKVRLENSTEKDLMRLTPPKQIVFFLSLILGIMGIIAYFVEIPFLSDYNFWVLAAAWGLLVLGAMLEDF